MFSLTRGGVAVSLAFFFFRASVACVEEYMPMYLKQLGLKALYIGLIPLFGLVTQTVGVPLFGFLADKFRARRLCLILATLTIIPNSFLFLLPQYPQHPCDHESSTSNSTMNNDTIALSLGNATVQYTKTTTNASQIGQPVSSMRFLRIDKIPTRLNKNRLSSIHRPELHQTELSDDNKSQKLLKFFLCMIALRGMFELVKRLMVTMLTVAVMTHTKNDRTRFGYYACWGEIGGGLALFLIGITVSRIRHWICGFFAPSYFIAFLYAVGFQLLTLVPYPWLKFEYFKHRVINYAEVKNILLNPHYFLLLIISCHGGLCASFQTRWEFWYMEKLGGSPVVMAVGGLVRRPVVAVWFLLSRHIVGRLGELNAIAVSLFIFAVSFAALAFVRNAWLVIVCDNFQSAAFIFIFTAMIIHFAKASSKASSGTIQGVVNLMFHGVGKEVGTALTGWLFTWQGTTVTLCFYSLETVAFLLIFTVYLFTAKDLDGYTQLSASDSVDEKE